jgi:hypothetical protein
MDNRVGNRSSGRLCWNESRLNSEETKDIKLAETLPAQRTSNKRCRISKGRCALDHKLIETHGKQFDRRGTGQPGPI